MFRKISFLAIIIPACCAFLAGCIQGPTGGTMCYVEADNPHESSGTPGSIVAKVRYSCAGDSREVTVQMRLQTRVSGTWRTIRDRRHVENFLNAGVERTLQVDVSCMQGTFRTWGQLESAVDSRGWRLDARNADHITSNVVTDPCG